MIKLERCIWQLVHNLAYHQFFKSQRILKVYWKMKSTLLFLNIQVIQLVKCALLRIVLNDQDGI